MVINSKMPDKKADETFSDYIDRINSTAGAEVLLAGLFRIHPECQKRSDSPNNLVLIIDDMDVMSGNNMIAALDSEPHRYARLIQDIDYWLDRAWDFDGIACVSMETCHTPHHDDLITMMNWSVYSIDWDTVDNLCHRTEPDVFNALLLLTGDGQWDCAEFENLMPKWEKEPDPPEDAERRLSNIFFQYKRDNPNFDLQYILSPLGKFDPEAIDDAFEYG